MNSANLCGFEHHGVSCPFPGVSGDAIKGNGPLFCHWHANVGNRDHGSAQHSFFSTHAKDAQCVKDTLAIWYGERNWREEMVDSLIAEHPEWSRGAETKSAYVARMSKVVEIQRKAA